MISFWEHWPTINLSFIILVSLAIIVVNPSEVLGDKNESSMADKPELMEMNIVLKLLKNKSLRPVTFDVHGTMTVHKEKSSKRLKSTGRVSENCTLKSKNPIVMTDVCLNAACNQTADEFLTDMDQGEKSCENFYRFVCGNFINRTQIPVGLHSINRLETIQTRAVQTFHELMTSESPTSELKAFKNMKKLYKTCMNTTAIEANGWETLKKHLKDHVGGWPVHEINLWLWDFIYDLFDYFFDKGLAINDFLVRSTTTDGTTYMREVKFNQVDSLLEYNPDSKNGLVDASKIEIYYKRMVNIAKMMGAKSPEQELKRIITLDRLIFHAHFREKLNNSTWTPSSVRKTSDKSRFWSNYWSKVAQWNISDIVNENISLVELENIPDIRDLFHWTPDIVQANYFIWRSVIMPAAQFLNKDFREAAGIIDSGSRQDECYRVVSEKLPLLVDFYNTKTYWTPKIKQDINAMMTTIQENINDALSQLNISWEKKKKLIEIPSISSSLNYLDEEIMFNNEKIEDFYDSLEIDEGNFLQSIVNVNLLYRKYEIDQFIDVAIPRDKWALKTYQNGGNKLMFDKEKNNFRLPMTVLHSSLFRQEAPYYVNFGGLGTQLSLKLSQAMLSNTEIPLSTYRNVDYRSKCRLCDKYPVKNETEFLAMAVAMDAAYAAFQKLLQDSPANSKLSNLPHDPKESFWISSVHSQCVKYRNSPLHAVSETESNLLRYLMNSLDFLQDFNCLDAFKPSDCPLRA